MCNVAQPRAKNVPTVVASGGVDSKTTQLNKTKTEAGIVPTEGNWQLKANWKLHACVQLALFTRVEFLSTLRKDAFDHEVDKLNGPRP